VPLVGGFMVNTTPKVIHDEIGLTPRGEVTVVDFVDFECPFCRMTHAEIQPILQPYREKVRLVRRQVPLRMHPHALDAARAACCGEQLGKGEAMADALFTSEDLTREGCEKIAGQLGLPLDAFRNCVTSPATDASIESDRTEFKAAGGYALPTIWIDETPIVGAQGGEVVSRVLHQALARAGS
jgi:predicted DsbA family dithiol-disulfide isomerase